MSLQKPPTAEITSLLSITTGTWTTNLPHSASEFCTHLISSLGFWRPETLSHSSDASQSRTSINVKQNQASTYFKMSTV